MEKQELQELKSKDNKILESKTLNLKPKTGFTLIELLVVIAILSVLATAVIVVLNPAQLIKQARDSNRISDLAALNSAIALYISDIPSPGWSNVFKCTYAVTTPMSSSCTATSTQTVDSTGWIPVAFTSISNGSPISKLPIDPVNNATYAYVYAHTTSTVYEIDANMESTKYANGGNSDVESTDGGNNTGWYEIGNDAGLDL